MPALGCVSRRCLNWQLCIMTWISWCLTSGNYSHLALVTRQILSSHFHPNIDHSLVMIDGAKIQDICFTQVHKIQGIPNLTTCFHGRFQYHVWVKYSAIFSVIHIFENTRSEKTIAKINTHLKVSVQQKYWEAYYLQHCDVRNYSYLIDTLFLKEEYSLVNYHELFYIFAYWVDTFQTLHTGHQCNSSYFKLKRWTVKSNNPKRMQKYCL